MRFQTWRLTHPRRNVRRKAIIKFAHDSGMAQKDMALRPFPLRARRGEMLADVAHSQRAIYRIGDRMHADIGVGMAFQAPVMGNGDSAQHDVIAGPEPVRV